ncbi:MAG: hypothetical protein Q8L14_20545 [Myxococcales bacterium]|nr:hypothetical protein [Myxococcales bacterium]
MVSAALFGVLLTVADPLDLAAQQTKELKYAQAAQSLKAAAQLTDLSRERVILFWETRGLVAAALGVPDEAQAAFANALRVDADFKLKGRPGPRFSTPYFEAKTQVKDRGGLSVSLIETRGDQESRVLIFSVSDPTSLVKKLRVAILEDGKLRVVVTDASARVEVPVRGSLVQAGVIALGERDWQLTERLQVRSAMTVASAAPPVAPRAVPAPPASAGAPPSLAESMTAPPRTVVRSVVDLRPSAWVLLGASVVAASVGVSTGILSRSGREAFATTTFDTREAALAADQNVRTMAMLANAGFLTAGVMAVSAAVVWLVAVFGNHTTETPVEGSAP